MIKIPSCCVNVHLIHAEPYLDARLSSLHTRFVLSQKVVCSCSKPHLLVGGLQNLFSAFIVCYIHFHLFRWIQRNARDGLYNQTLVLVML